MAWSIHCPLTESYFSRKLYSGKTLVCVIYIPNIYQVLPAGTSVSTGNTEENNRVDIIDELVAKPPVPSDTNPLTDDFLTAMVD